MRRLARICLLLALVACSSGARFAHADLPKVFDGDGLVAKEIPLAGLSRLAPLNDDDKRAIRLAGFDIARGGEEPRVTCGRLQCRSVMALAMTFHSVDGAAEGLGIVKGALRRLASPVAGELIGDEAAEFRWRSESAQEVLLFRRANMLVVVQGITQNPLTLARAIDSRAQALRA